MGSTRGSFDFFSPRCSRSNVSSTTILHVLAIRDEFVRGSITVIDNGQYITSQSPKVCIIMIAGIILKTRDDD